MPGFHQILNLFYQRSRSTETFMSTIKEDLDEIIDPRRGHFNGLYFEEECLPFVRQNRNCGGTFSVLSFKRFFRASLTTNVKWGCCN